MIGLNYNVFKIKYLKILLNAFLLYFRSEFTSKALDDTLLIFVPAESGNYRHQRSVYKVLYERNITKEESRINNDNRQLENQFCYIIKG